MSEVWEFVNWIGLVLAVLALLAWTVTFASTIAMFYLVSLHWRLRAAGMADEVRRLSQPLLPDAMLPDVVIQIPTFNEGRLAARALAAATGLDWPRERLHIQVLDDSTDGSAAFAASEVETCRARGFDVVLIHRHDRAEFKAGALANGMRQSPHGYFAILDVDYVPEPDFLRKAMVCLLAEPELGFIQARFDYLNADDSDLTRTQAILLDAHLSIEQATRSWAGHPLPFNGTCGIWRREAIEAAGGWYGTTLTEDLDLTYRAWLIGRRGRFLVSVAVPGELPDEWQSWVVQQKRWTKGFGEVSLRVLWPVLTRKGLSAADKFAAAMHLGVWWAGPAWAVALPVGLAAIILDPFEMWPLALVLLGQIVLGYAALFVFLRSGNASLRPGALTFHAFVRRFFTISRILFSMGAAIGAAQREVIFRRRSDFVRTPKIASAGEPGQAL